MPRFGFLVYDGVGDPNEHSFGFPDIDAAQNEAAHLASDLLRDQVLGPNPIKPLCVEVADEAGNVMVSIAVTLTYRNNPDHRIGGDATSAMA